jgi:hypothetical protein
MVHPFDSIRHFLGSDDDDDNDDDDDPGTDIANDDPIRSISVDKSPLVVGESPASS